MQNHSSEKNMFEVYIFHCFCSQFRISDAYLMVQNKHLRIIFDSNSKQVFDKTNFQKLHLQNYFKKGENNSSPITGQKFYFTHIQGLKLFF
jgi:hypothetical protein